MTRQTAKPVHLDRQTYERILNSKQDEVRESLERVIEAAAAILRERSRTDDFANARLSKVNHELREAVQAAAKAWETRGTVTASDAEADRISCQITASFAHDTAIRKAIAEFPVYVTRKEFERCEADSAFRAALIAKRKPRRAL